MPQRATKEDIRALAEILLTERGQDPEGPALGWAPGGILASLRDRGWITGPTRMTATVTDQGSAVVSNSASYKSHLEMAKERGLGGDKADRLALQMVAAGRKRESRRSNPAHGGMGLGTIMGIAAAVGAAVGGLKALLTKKA